MLPIPAVNRHVTPVVGQEGQENNEEVIASFRCGAVVCPGGLGMSWRGKRNNDGAACA